MVWAICSARSGSMPAIALATAASDRACSSGLVMVRARASASRVRGFGAVVVGAGDRFGRHRSAHVPLAAVPAPQCAVRSCRCPQEGRCSYGLASGCAELFWATSMGRALMISRATWRFKQRMISGLDRPS